MILRLVGFLGMGAFFLLISPGLRNFIETGIGKITQLLNAYSPYSYIAVGLSLFTFLTVSLYRTAVPTTIKKPEDDWT